MIALTLKNILHYELKEKLGEGGMGEVYKAVDTNLARPVAIKILPRSLAFDEEARLRFHREVKAASALNHPNIVTIFETGEFENRLFLSMEYVEGKTVRQMLEKGPIPREKAIDIMKQTLTGLSAAHQANIIHRDMKPENIMVRTDNYVKILDFGLAKFLDKTGETLSLTQGIVGTPRYMSPEQATGRNIDTRTDVFSAGAVFYEMLSGRCPFAGENVHQILSAIISPQMPPMLEGEKKELIALIYKSLQKEPEKRYKNALEMLTDLVAFTSGSFEIPTPIEEQSVIVIPVAANDDDLDIADGITEELIDSISKLNGMRVMSTAVSLKYRGREQDLKEIGKELNVNLALMGTLRRRKDRAKVNIQLVNTRDNFQVWGDHFRFRVDDVFEAEEEIATTVTNFLREHFLPVKDVQLAKPTPRDEFAASTAREFYLNGMYLLSSLREEDIRKSVDFFKKAIEADPDFSTAHAKLSEAYLYIFMLEGIKADQDLLIKAKNEAEKAFSLKPENPEAQVSLSLLDIIQLDMKGAMEKLEGVLSTKPNHPGALSWLSYLYTNSGNPDMGVAMARKAIQREPRNTNHFIWLSYALFSQGRYMEASDALDRTIRIDPRNPYPYALLLFVNLANNRLDDAKMLYDYICNFTEDQPTTRLAKFLYLEKVGKPVSQLDEETLQALTMDPEGSRFAADFYALKGDREKMYRMLRQSIEISCHNLAWLDTDPFLKPYKDEDEFIQIRKELKRLVEIKKEK